MDLNCAPEKGERLICRDLLRTEVRFIHTTWTDLFWKLLFQLKTQSTLNSSASKYIVFVTSHSDLPVSPSLFLFTSLLHPVTSITWSSIEELATLSRSGYKNNEYFYFSICLPWSRSFEGLRWLELWRSYVSSKIPTKNLTCLDLEGMRSLLHPQVLADSMYPVYEQVTFQNGVQKSQFLHKFSKFT